MGHVTPVRRVGGSERFRSASWVERAVARLRGPGQHAAPPLLKRAYEYVLDHLPGDHLRPRLPGGERLRLSARYRHLTWNPQEYAAFRGALAAGNTVFDVGANVGAYTLAFAEWVGPTGHVYAFEPGPDARSGLRTHVALNGFDDRVRIVDAAVGAHTGRASFAVHPSGGASSLLLDSVAGGRTIDVQTETLDGFCEMSGVRPHFVKIDVEGAELDVLRGGRRTLSPPDVQVFVEFHPSAWVVIGIGRADVERELAAQGFEAQPLDPSVDIWNSEGVTVRLRRR